MNLQNETAQKVLECACELFAEKGYSGASISDICGKAEANRSAVNYYFRSKQDLYKQVFNHAWDCFSSTYTFGQDEGIPSEEKLYTFISALIHGIFDPGTGGWFMQLLFHEAVAPSESIEHVVLDIILHIRTRLDQIIIELTGETDTEKVYAMNMSVMSQCLFFNMTRNIRKYKMVNRIPPFDRPEFNSINKMKDVIDHIYQFSLNGLLANK